MLHCRIFALLLLLCSSLLPLGCGPGNGRLRVSGTVTVDGQPLQAGSIRFRPAPGNSAGSAGGRIADGRYQIAAAQGLLPGEYLVTIEATKKTGKQIDDPQMGLIDELAPVEFNETGQLTATISAGSGNVHNFDLTTAR